MFFVAIVCINFLNRILIVRDWLADRWEDWGLAFIIFIVFRYD